jgi:FSR family fosmidomycin resistance protein-like MFS transporter
MAVTEEKRFNTETTGLATRRDEHRVAAVACGAHALHDGFTDLIYVLLPLWQKEFGLGYGELGLLRALFSGTMAGFQIPSGLLAERLGAALVLALGTALSGIGYCLAGASASLGVLMLALFSAGLGSSTQHPLASSLMAHAFAGERSMKAIGTYNFAGDIGKMTIPAIASLLLVVLPWRSVMALFGMLGVVVGLAIYILTPQLSGKSATEHSSRVNEGKSLPNVHWIAFPTLTVIAMIDSATRMGFLLFLPFILTAKGASVPTIGIALTLIFAGGAMGKLLCGFIGARIGAIPTVWLTEGLTAVLIVSLLPLALEPTLPLLPLIGVALNGTSSVLYGSVPDLVAPERRARAFSIFYTGAIGAGATAPILYGIIGDALGVIPAVLMIAGLVLLTLPLSLVLRSYGQLTQGRSRVVNSDPVAGKRLAR